MVRIHASILAICAGHALASGTCQSDTVAEDVSLLQGRHKVKKHAALQPPAQVWDGSGSPPEGPGWHRLDLTVGDIPERQNKARQFETFYRFGNADQHIMYAPAGDKGICMAVVEPTPGFGHATTGPILGNPDNHYSPDGSTPFAPRDDTVSAAELKGDNAIGMMLPFPTPRRLRLRMSSANVVDDNAPTLFSEMQLSIREVDQSQLTRSHYPVTQGFMGIQTGLPQDVSGGAENYESWYIRPSNGAGPGPNQFNPTTSAQFCADPGFEWFWLRSHAFDGSNGAVPTDATTNFVFEGSAQTNFANEDIDSMLENANTLEYTFDDADTGVNMVVNGQRVVSAVTNEPFDRTVFGSREASVLSGSRTAIMFEPGVYLCVQSIEWLNEEEEDAAPELPPVPAGYAERVRNWVAENPAVAAVFRQAIREQLIQVVQLADRDDVRNFARNFPRAANAMRQWARNNPDQAQRAAALVSEIRDAGDGGAALLHEWAAANPAAAAVLRAVTRARLIQFVLHADRNDVLDAEETFPAATLRVRAWARNNPGRARRVVRVIRGLRDEASLLEMAEEPIEELEPEEGTEGASTPLDFDSTEGPATEEQQTGLEAEALTQELVDECNENRRTGGTCFFSNCYDWRGATECRRGRCVCAQDTCSAREFGNSGRRGVCFQPLEWQEMTLQR